MPRRKKTGGVISQGPYILVVVLGISLIKLNWLIWKTKFVKTEYINKIVL